jgi:hypothetical protein
MTRNADFAREAERLEREWGIVFPGAMDYLPDAFRRDYAMALDAQPALVTGANAGIPSMFTSFVDPETVRVRQAPNVGAKILSEQRMGTWIDQTAFFPVVENTGQVNSYGDFNEDGKSDANANFVQRQSYLFQTIIEYGDLEVERAGAARLNWVSEKQIAAAKTLSKFEDLVYHLGVNGLENFGLLNDPTLSAPLTPGTKAAGGVQWVKNGQINATSNEVYQDFQALYNELTTNGQGLISEDTPFRFVYPNTAAAGMTATNQFGMTVKALIKESFSNVEYVVAPRYATAAGNEVQLIALEFDGSKTGRCAFNEKMRAHRIVPKSSSFSQKHSSGSWGAVIMYPMAIASMLGV